MLLQGAIGLLKGQGQQQGRPQAALVVALFIGVQVLLQIVADLVGNPKGLAETSQRIHRVLRSARGHRAELQGHAEGRGSLAAISA